MKKRYQIDKQRAVQQFRRLANETSPNIQMVLPLAGIVGMLQEGVVHLMREAGLLLMIGVMEEEVRHVVGERSVPNADRQASRWGKERGYCVVDGQKVPIHRTRVRDKANREVKLGSYELFQRSGPLEAAVWVATWSRSRTCAAGGPDMIQRYRKPSGHLADLSLR